MDDLFLKLSKSKFRSSFYLNKDMKEYVRKKGLDVIRNHAYDFINKRIKPAYPKNDGKQTAYKGHPVFISQHATGTCCRGCLSKWYHIPKGVELTSGQVDYIVNVIMKWIENEMENSLKNV